MTHLTADALILRSNPGMLSKGCQYQLDNDPEFGFLLVRQKDHILELINHRRYNEARACLVVLEELWTTCNYSYKLKELRERINLSQRKVQEPND